jgi:hypothetical protein
VEIDAEAARSPVIIYHTFIYNLQQIVHLFIEKGEAVKAPMKVRVEVTTEEGMKSSMEKEGDLQHEMLKQLTITEVVKFLRAQLAPLSVEDEEFTIKERLASFLRFHQRAPTSWFTSSQMKKIYEEEYEESVRLSTISTYLASMHSDGILERGGSRAKRQYRVVSSKLEIPVIFDLGNGNPEVDTLNLNRSP